jgi:maltose O-acetyltransferase
MPNAFDKYSGVSHTLVFKIVQRSIVALIRNNPDLSISVFINLNVNCTGSAADRTVFKLPPLNFPGGSGGRNREGIVMRTEKEKMLAGELYDALDPALVAARERARDLCQDLNAAREREQDVRRRILKELLGSGGDSAWLQPPFYCDYGSNIYLGERVYFNFNCVILDVCEVRIGDFSFFGPAVQIYAATHPIDAQLRRTKEFGKPVTIGSDSWIGGGAIICPGVTIGSKTVIGAGSVVTKNIPDGVIAAGNPCRIIREITETDRDNKSL